MALTHDDMVDDFDFEQLAGSDEVSRDFNVGFRRCGFAAGMIVHDHDSRRSSDNRQTEYFPWMNQNGVHRSHGYKIVSFDFPPRVQN